jgi:fatty-acyl-CoA synthase
MIDRPELRKRAANFVPLSPVSFLARAADFFGDRVAILHGERRFTYREFYARARQLAHALTKAGVKRGDTVAILAANTPAMLEAHFAAPMIGAVVNPINVRLDAPLIAFCLEHGEAKVLLADREFHATIAPALGCWAASVRSSSTSPTPRPMGRRTSARSSTRTSSPRAMPLRLRRPRGRVGQHLPALHLRHDRQPQGRGLQPPRRLPGALANALTFKLDHESRYLWTLPMFHCSGWTFTWAVAATGGTHVCLRKVEPKRIFDAIVQHRVTHMCGAPIVLNMLVHAPAEAKRPLPLRTKVATGGAAPPAIVIERMEALGFEVLHVYGTTESYGPSTYCPPMPEWQALPESERFTRMARQGIPNPLIEHLMVADPRTLEPVPRDGATVGEIMLSGNTLMKGYLKNEAATDEAFAGGTYHSGDLAAWHGDGSIEVKDRSKDIIISGGENISSLEVEEVLYRHPQVMEAAVVARFDEKWGEHPCAFVALKSGSGPITAADVIAFCRANMAHFKVPRTVIFGELPKTSTGKIQKFVLRDKANALK